MAAKVKIKITDADSYREELDSLYEQTGQVALARYSIQLAKHILALSGMDIQKLEEVRNGFAVNERWQNGQARMHDVRQAGFELHRLARGCGDEVKKTALRTAGQAVGSGHMREHAMVASDYAVKVINLLYPGNIEAVKQERTWQIQEMQKQQEGFRKK